MAVNLRTCRIHSCRVSDPECAYPLVVPNRGYTTIGIGVPWHEVFLRISEIMGQDVPKFFFTQMTKNLNVQMFAEENKDVNI